MLDRRTFLGAAALGLLTPALQTRTQILAKTSPDRGETARGRKVAEIEKSLNITRNIPFVKRPERTLYLDVYRQSKPGAQPVPAIIYFGLSGWRSDTKEFWAYILGLNHLEPDPLVYLYPAIMVPRGYVVISAECRVAKEAIFPAAVLDGKCAIKWTRTHAEKFGIDPARIAVMGGSASGYLAAMLAVTRPQDGFEDEKYYSGVSTAIQSAYCQSGMYDFVYYEQKPGDGSLDRDTMISDFLGGSYAQVPKTWRRASPINYVRRGDPPFLLMHGIQDRRVPYVQMAHFASALKKARVPVEAISINHFVHGAMPGVMPQPSDSALDQIIYKFFDRRLNSAA